MEAFALLAGIGLSAGAARAGATQSPAAASDAASAAPSTPADDEAASELREHHRHHHDGGVLRFVAMSLDTLGTDESKAPQIQKLQSDLRDRMAPARDADKQLLNTLADGVAAGAFDQAKVDAAIARLTSAAAAAHDAGLDTLNQIHAVLSPAERAALVDKVQAHWEVWRQVNQEARPGRQGGRLAELTREVSLTPDQLAKASAALRGASTRPAAKFNPKKAEERVRAFATAFVAESFDAKSLASKSVAIAGYGSARMARFYETVMPLLTPEQRAKLAELLREHANDQPTASAEN